MTFLILVQRVESIPVARPEEKEESEDEETVGSATVQFLESSACVGMS